MGWYFWDGDPWWFTRVGSKTSPKQQIQGSTLRKHFTLPLATIFQQALVLSFRDTNIYNDITYIYRHLVDFLVGQSYHFSLLHGAFAMYEL